MKPVLLHLLPDYRPDDVWASAEQLAFNGAYVLVGSLKDSPIILRRNRQYREAEDVYFDEVEIQACGNEQSAVADFLSGDVDIVQLGANRHSAVVTSINPELIRRTGIALATFFAFNLSRPNVHDLRVRQALAMTASSSDVLVAAANDTSPLDVHLPPNIDGYPRNVPKPEWSSMSLHARLAKARTIMSAAGFGPENRMKLQLKTMDSDTYRSMGRIVQKIWSQIFVDVELVITGVAEHYSKNWVMGGNFDVAEIRWISGVNNAYAFFAFLETDGYVNRTSWSNPDCDRLLALYRTSQSQSERDDAAHQMLKIIQAELPVSPVYRRLDASLVQADLQGFESNPLAAQVFRYVSRSATN